ncbi:class I SAM-dependent methyltransferase [Mycobacterium sp. URHB0021]|jgi:methyltransferase (TIGR00027 family)
MARAEDDTWDLATSVGATATGVAVGRALASRAPDPLIDDPFAEPLVRAVGVEFFTRLATGDLDPHDVDGEAAFGMARMAGMMAVRTRLIDDFFLDAGRLGVRQAVILASGLDARAYRLPWPSGTTVYEIDQPDVVDFKTDALTQLGARPATRRRGVPVDLRHDWPAALQEASFDPKLPTAWSAEGLLPFLPSDAQDQLLDNITALSPKGSWLICESMPGGAESADAFKNGLNGAVENWRKHGFDVEMTDLLYSGERNDVADYLGDRGWTTTGTTSAELFARHGREVPVTIEGAPDLAAITYVIAQRQ